MSKISICVPLYRSETFGEHFSSVVEQTNKDFHLMISNDGPDKSIKELIFDTFPQAQYVHNQPSLGEIPNSNTVISLADTEYVCLFHDDDFLDPDFIEEAYRFIELNPDVDVFYTGRVMVNEENEEIARQLAQTEKKYFVWDTKTWLDHFLLGSSFSYAVPLMTPGLVFKNSLFEAVGGFDDSVDTHCDTDLLYKMLALGKQIGYINRPLYISKVWYGNSGRTQSSKKGTVYQAQKDIVLGCLDFCASNGVQRYQGKQQQVLAHFARTCIAINGPLMWLKLRYEGGQKNLLSIQKTIIEDLVRLAPEIVWNWYFYFVLFVSIVIPKSILSSIHKQVLPRILRG